MRIRNVDDLYLPPRKLLSPEDLEGKGLFEKPQRRLRFESLLHYNTSAALRTAGVRALPVRLMETKWGYRYFQPDLRLGGKYEVEEWAHGEKGSIRRNEKRVSNYDEIREEIERQTKKAAEAGFDIQPVAWHVQIDPETRRGRPFVSDLKWIYYKPELRKSAPD